MESTHGQILNSFFFIIEEWKAVFVSVEEAESTGQGNGIREWFVMERTLKIIKFQLPWHRQVAQRKLASSSSKPSPNGKHHLNSQNLPREYQALPLAPGIPAQGRSSGMEQPFPGLSCISWECQKGNRHMCPWAKSNTPRLSVSGGVSGRAQSWWDQWALLLPIHQHRLGHTWKENHWKM